MAATPSPTISESLQQRANPNRSHMETVRQKALNYSLPSLPFEEWATPISLLLRHCNATHQAHQWLCLACGLLVPGLVSHQHLMSPLQARQA